MSFKHKALFEQIVSDENLRSAYSKTQKGKLKYQSASMRFSQNLSENLKRLQMEVISGIYRPDGYYSFKVFEPKERLIFAPKFRDKIVQHMLNSVLKDVYRPCFIYDSYSCIEGKGTHRAVKRISTFMRGAKYWYGEASYIIKLDIEKFFYSIDRNILKALLRKKITCVRTLALADELINSSPSQQGLPLGNLTSQLFANIYLNELDQYCKRALHAHYYVRYADDVTIFVRSKAQARIMLANISSFLSERLNLRLHPEKSKIFPLAQGVNTLGFKIHPTHRLLRNRSKQAIKSRLRALESGHIQPHLAAPILNSWRGHAALANAGSFTNCLIARHPWVSRSHNGVFTSELSHVLH